jgi:hypothetical protein
MTKNTASVAYSNCGGFIKKRFGVCGLQLVTLRADAFVSCNEQDCHHAKISFVCMPPSSTWHAAQSGDMQLKV